MNDVDVARGFPARLATRLSFLVAGIAMASWAPQVPYAAARLGLGNSAFGLLLLCLGIGSVLAMQVTGAAVARFGSRAVVLVGGVGLCLTGHLTRTRGKPRPSGRGRIAPTAKLS